MARYVEKVEGDDPQLEVERDKFKDEFFLTELQFKILSLMQEHPSWTQQKIADKLGIRQSKVSQNLQQMYRNNDNLHEFIWKFNKVRKLNCYRLFPPK